MNIQSLKQLRTEIKQEFLSVDPVSWVEHNCTIDGDPMLIRKAGRKYLVDIYRYIAINALRPNGKPIVIYKGRQVEMSTTALALDCYFMGANLFGTPTPEEIENGNVRKLPRIKVMHCFPQDKQAHKFIKEKAAPFMNSIKGDLLNKIKGDSDTDRIKQFAGDNSLFFESTGVSADRIRGLSFDVLFFDEFQDFYKEAISNAKMLLKQARHGPHGKGVQVYFGTPKEKGTFFNDTWDKSDKRLYHLRCKECGEYFPMFDPDNESWPWEEIWVRGNIVKCPYCNKLQDKVQAVNAGKWIPTKEEGSFVGFHLNLFIHPKYTKENILDDHPSRNPVMTEKRFQNEVLGRFHSGLGETITPQQIEEFCADKDRAISPVGIPNVSTYLGLDWGKRVEGEEGGKSFSVAVIIEAHGETVKILNAFRLKTRDFTTKVNVVEEIFKRYGIRQCVADLGFGEEVVGELQKKMMNRILGYYNQTNFKKPYKYIKGNNFILANKDVMIEQAFDLMKVGKVRFPFAESTFKDISFLIDHCCSMEIGTKVKHEQEINTYVKGGKPNDGLMALCYAILAYKFVITNGFTLTSNVGRIKQFQVEDPRPAVLGYIPKWR